MSKRIVKDPVTKADLQVTRTPQPRRGTGRDAKTQKYFERNYLDVLEIITPNVYWEDDFNLSGVEVSELDQLINSNILVANSSGAVAASSLEGINYLSSLSTVDGIAQFFINQNNLTWFTTQNFDNKILYPLQTKAKDTVLSSVVKTLDKFETSSEFATFVSGTFLPYSVLEMTSGPGNNLATNTLSAYDNTSSGTHKYLIDNLSWLYLLNRPDPAGANVRPTGYATSSEITKLLIEKTWSGKVVGLEDTMKLFQKYIWSNYAYFSGIDEQTIPQRYRGTLLPNDTLSGTDTYVSGTQLRDRLETLAGIIYSDKHFNNKDSKVEDSFADYISTASLITDTENAGPFTRFMKAIAFSIANRSGEAGEIETLMDIESCPDEMLPYLADLIGWKLLGSDASRCRNQIRQAVSIYKAKGTQLSVQFIADAVFGTSAFNVVDNQLFDLWESYLPNLIYYSIATSSTLTERGLETFTRQKAADLGLDVYSPTNLDHNIRVAVDRIMYELIGEFPDNFIYAGKPYPRTQLYYADDPVTPNYELPYNGPWVKYPSGKYYTAPEDPTVIIDENNLSITNTFQLILAQTVEFSYKYRGREMPFPAWESIRYYQECTLTTALLDALRFKLLCFGVYDSLATELVNYIKDNTVKKSDISYLTNALLFFTDTEKFPPNYDNILTVDNPRGNELIKYLPYWNSKSSHFKLKFAASSFDFVSRDSTADTGYALENIKTCIDTVTPAHAIPEILLDLSSVEDVRMELSSASYANTRLPLSSLVVDSSAASSTILANFSVSAVNPYIVLSGPPLLATTFKRADVSSLANRLFASGTYNVSTEVFFSSAPRNTIRRKNHKYLLNHEEIDLRDGIGVPGFDFLDSAFQLAAIYGTGAARKTNIVASGLFSLGFNPSALSYAYMPLYREPFGFSNLLEISSFPAVWERCENYNSSNIFSGIPVSNTFPYRGYASPQSSEPSGFFSRRESLNDLLALMHRVSYADRLFQASSIVSGYYLDNGTVNSAWPTSSPLIEPVTLSSWYKDGYRDVITSIGNQLEETDASSTNLNYMEDFQFGRKLSALYQEWLTMYGHTALSFNYTKVASYNPSILSHTYGPYLFNADFELTASSLALVPALITTDVSSVIGISFGEDTGVLSLNNVSGIQNYAATANSDMYVSLPEVRNDTILSGMELVDTSTYTGDTVEPPLYPTFAVLKIDKVKKAPITQTTLPDGYNRTLEDNTLLRYTRNYNNSLPRLRFKIEPDSSRPDIKNLLVPDSEFSLFIKSAQILRDSPTAALGTLRVWIHTEPIDYVTQYALSPQASPGMAYNTEASIWSFANNKWVRNNLSDLSGPTGRSFVTANSLSQKYTVPDPVNTEVITRGTSTSLLTGEVTSPYIFPPLPPRIGCIENLTTEVTNLIQEPISETLFESMNFEFNTRNDLVEVHPTREKLHTKDRKYYIEIFVEEADRDAYIIFDNITMANRTLQEKAVIGARHGEYYLDRKELKTCLDYFTELSKSKEASRNAMVTSGALETSGGSRLSYRQNVNRNIPTWNSSYFQLTGMIIRGN